MLINVPAVRNIHHSEESVWQSGRDAKTEEWEQKQRDTCVILSLHFCSIVAVLWCSHKFKFILLKEEKLGNIFYRHAYLSSYITLQILFILLMAIEKCVAFYFWSILGSPFVFPTSNADMCVVFFSFSLVPEWMNEWMDGWYVWIVR